MSRHHQPQRRLFPREELRDTQQARQLLSAAGTVRLTETERSEIRRSVWMEVTNPRPAAQKVRAGGVRTRWMQGAAVAAVAAVIFGVVPTTQPTETPPAETATIQEDGGGVDLYSSPGDGDDTAGTVTFDSREGGDVECGGVEETPQTAEVDDSAEERNEAAVGERAECLQTPTTTSLVEEGVGGGVTGRGVDPEPRDGE